jgi:hypothetical protein
MKAAETLIAWNDADPVYVLSVLPLLILIKYRDRSEA